MKSLFVEVELQSSILLFLLMLHLYELYVQKAVEENNINLKVKFDQCSMSSNSCILVLTMLVSLFTLRKPNLRQLSTLPDGWVISIFPHHCGSPVKVQFCSRNKLSSDSEISLPWFLVFLSQSRTACYGKPMVATPNSSRKSTLTLQCLVILLENSPKRRQQWVNATSVP